MTQQLDKLAGSVRSSFEANADALKARLAKATTKEEREEISREASMLASSLGATEAFRRSQRTPQSFLKLACIIQPEACVSQKCELNAMLLCYYCLPDTLLHRQWLTSVGTCTCLWVDWERFADWGRHAPPVR